MRECLDWMVGKGPLVTCLATRECLDWMVGKGPLVSAGMGLYLPEPDEEAAGGAAPPIMALSSFHRVLTPSIIFWTSSTSEYPSLCLLEMSQVCPVCPPDSPRVPRGCS